MEGPAPTGSAVELGLGDEEKENDHTSNLEEYLQSRA